MNATWYHVVISTYTDLGSDTLSVSPDREASYLYAAREARYLETYAPGVVVTVVEVAG